MSRVATGEATVAARLRAAGLEIAPERSAALSAYIELLAQWNRVFNLTGIRSREELVERHLVESLTLAPLLRGTRVADIGTGAGLPGIPLAIAAPEREFTLIESRAKRVRFLRHAVSMLDLGNARVEHCRAEDLPNTSPFDTVLARAVAPPEQLIRLARPLLVPGGVLLVLTAAHLADELRSLGPRLGLQPIRACEAVFRQSGLARRSSAKSGLARRSSAKSGLARRSSANQGLRGGLPPNQGLRGGFQPKAGLAGRTSARSGLARQSVEKQTVRSGGPPDPAARNGSPPNTDAARRTAAECRLEAAGRIRSVIAALERPAHGKAKRSAQGDAERPAQWEGQWPE